MDTNPAVNWIYPNKDLEKFSELKGVELGHMSLLHKNDDHFNLVATLGSLSYRFNIGPIEEKKTTEQDRTIDENVDENVDQVHESEDEDDKAIEIEKLKKALESSEKSKLIFQREYFK